MYLPHIYMYMYICIYISYETCAWTPNNVFCQRLLWKSVLCKFRWRLRGMYTPPTLIGVSACTFFFVALFAGRPQQRQLLR